MTNMSGEVERGPITSSKGSNRKVISFSVMLILTTQFCFLFSKVYNKLTNSNWRGVIGKKTKPKQCQASKGWMKCIMERKLVRVSLVKFQKKKEKAVLVTEPKPFYQVRNKTLFCFLI